METTEKQIWRHIANNAKKKCDYATFEEEVDKIFEGAAHGLLFKIIFLYAVKKPKDAIMREIMGELLAIGYNIFESGIFKFISDKDVVFAFEIELTRLAINMLNANEEEQTVLDLIIQKIQEAENTDNINPS